MSDPIRKNRQGPPLVKVEEGVENNHPAPKPVKVQRFETEQTPTALRLSSSPILDNAVPDSAVFSSESLGPSDAKEMATATLKQQLEKKRAELVTEEESYWKAREHQVTVDQTVSTLTSKRKELKRELGTVRDELALGKEDQQRAAVSTQECFAKKTRVQAEFDSLLAQVYSSIGLDSINDPSLVRVPRKRPALGGQDLESGEEWEFHGGFQPPMKDSSRASYPGGNTNRTKKKKTDKEEGDSFTPKTREDLFALVHQAAKKDESNQAPKATLTGFVNKVSLAKLRKVLELPSQSRALSASHMSTEKNLRVLHHGNFQLRDDFGRKDKAWQSRVLGAHGKLIIRSDTNVDMQRRLIELLEIPE